MTWEQVVTICNLFFDKLLEIFPIFSLWPILLNVKLLVFCSVLYLHDPQGRWSGTYLSIQTVSTSVSTYWFPLNKYLS